MRIKIENEISAYIAEWIVSQRTKLTAAENKLLFSADEWKLYEVHDAFKKCVPYYPTAAEICKEIEDFILELQQKTTLPQRFNVEELMEQGAV